MYFKNLFKLKLFILENPNKLLLKPFNRKISSYSYKSNNVYKSRYSLIFGKNNLYLSKHFSTSSDPKSPAETGKSILKIIQF